MITVDENDLRILAGKYGLSVDSDIEPPVRITTEVLLNATAALSEMMSDPKFDEVQPACQLPMGRL